MEWWIVLALVLGVLLIVLVHDLLQRRHAILRTYPVIGHFRYLLEMFGPELRQYIVTDNNEERPFSRDERRWIYASAKQQNNSFGFGTDNNLDARSDYLIVKHATFPEPPIDGEPSVTEPTFLVPCAKVLGGAHGREHAFRPASIVNLSAMSFGSLSGAALDALNRGAELASCLHNTGEGGISEYHLRGGSLTFQMGTGYFGCHDADGRFSLEQLLATIDGAPVRSIEIKLSQGAKPGLGGLLPAAKVTQRIAEVRGVTAGETCESPNAHSAFSDVDTMIEFIESLADATGLPVGIKSAVGDDRFWDELATRMVMTGAGPDFVTIDGGEGGTGAAPMVFADHVSFPFLRGFPRVYRAFAEHGLTDDLVFTGSGRLGLAERGLAAFALGCDTINVGREAMMAVGCVQAQRCHTGRCPSGVATQSEWRQRGVDPELKSVRVANYIAVLRQELLRLARACGHRHPSMVRPDQIELLTDGLGSRSLAEHAGYDREPS